MAKPDWKEDVEDWFSAERVATRWDAMYASDRAKPDEDSFRQRRDFAVALVERRVPQEGRVLDLGCGAGAVLAELLDSRRQVVGLDYAPDMLGFARRRLRERQLDPRVLLRGEAGQLPFADGSFECVICLGVISYQRDYSAMLREINRVLAPGGVALITFRNIFHPLASDPWKAIKAIGRLVLTRRPPTQEGLGRGLSPTLVRRDIERNGLRCESFEGIGLGPFAVAGRRLLDDRRSIRLSRALVGLLRRTRLGWTLRWSADVAMFVCRKE